MHLDYTKSMVKYSYDNSRPLLFHDYALNKHKPHHPQFPKLHQTRANLSYGVERKGRILKWFNKLKKLTQKHHIDNGNINLGLHLIEPERTDD